MEKIKKKKGNNGTLFLCNMRKLVGIRKWFPVWKERKEQQKYPNCVKRNEDTKPFLCLFFFFHFLLERLLGNIS